MHGGGGAEVRRTLAIWPARRRGGEGEQAAEIRGLSLCTTAPPRLAEVTCLAL